MPRFFANPNAAERLGDILLKDLKSKKWQKFTAAIAFLKRSGIERIAAAIRRFSDRKPVKIVVGIDHGGTTQEGLEILLRAMGRYGEAFVFHRKGSTFHPKLYVFENDDTLKCIVGSGNATKGGFYENFEAFLVSDTDLSDAEHSTMVMELHSTISDWTDPTTDVCRRLTPQLIKDLRNSGLIPTEAEARMQLRKNASGTPRKAKGRVTPIFGTIPIKRAPTFTKAKAKTKRKTPPASTTASAKSFYMTLQKCDVGVGQTHPNTGRRSPEIFIPKACVKADPDFWGWPYAFTADPKWKGTPDRDGFGKMDRTVTMSVNGQIVTAAWWYNPTKKDYRLRTEALRSAGRIGDVLRIDKVSPRAGFEYHAVVIPQGTADFPRSRSACSIPVINSLKHFGYV